jgi:hypothetical protein
VAYPVIKRVKGRPYLYIQESYREGGGVKTRSVYLGPLDPETGELVETGGNDPELVERVRQEVRDRIVIAGDPNERGKVWEIPPRRGKSPFAAEAGKSRPGGEYCRLSFKIDCSRFAISRNSLEEDEAQFRKRLGRLGVLPADIPGISVEYGARLRVFKRVLSGQYAVTIPKYSKGNREHLRREIRRALSFASLDALERKRPDLFCTLSLQFDEHFRETQRLLNAYILATNEFDRLPKAIALKYFGMLAPIAGGKLPPVKIGVSEYGRRKDWREDVASLMVDILRRGWNNVYSESISEALKARRAPRYIVKDQKMTLMKQRLALQRAELRVRLQEEKQEKLRTLRKVFGY